MCGLVTIHSNSSVLQERQPVLAEMLTSIAHRGPDGVGILEIEGQVLLGHRRLAIIDLEHGAQPMCSEDKRFSLVFNA